MTLYPVHERFRTFQGECAHMGRPAYFLRLFGCPIHCPWCDSAGTWHKDFVPKNVQRMTIHEVVREASQKPVVDFVVITGGEPAVHDLGPLVHALAIEGIPCHLETSGAFPLPVKFAWVTVSPKRWKMPVAETVHAAHEFKLIIEHPDDIPFYTDYLVDVLGEQILQDVWLHPEWSHRRDPLVLNAISKAVVGKERDVKYRAGWQIHKLYAVDLADNRSRPPVPLGGDPTKGF